MSIFDETFEKAKDAFDIAAKKSSEVIEMQKLRFNISSINSQINKYYETLGKTVYENRKSEEENNEVLIPIFEEIDKKYTELDEAVQKVSDIKKMKLCKKCNMYNRYDAVFCDKCGEQL